MNYKQTPAELALCEALIDDTAQKLSRFRRDPQSYAGLREQIVLLIRQLRSALYPDVYGDYGPDGGPRPARPADCLRRAHISLRQILCRVLSDAARAEDIAQALIRELPAIKEVLETDVQAAYQGDPAAQSYQEVMLAYPAFEAISIFRIAHCLYRLQVPVVPRMMTEYAHQTTGIDVHPGADIGKYFFIDHGTGVVIGETTTIGHHVKLYQGVTLGAKSFEVGEDGVLVKGVKRHPDLGNHVVVYAGATILGGDTRIGDDCVIGGNVWLTHSVPAGQLVLAAHEREIHIPRDKS